MRGFVGAIDQGTTSTRFLIFDRKGGIVGAAQKEHEQIYPKPGWVEHNATEIWRNTVSTMVDALASAGSPPPISSASASPISARRRFFGIAPPASRSATLLFGRTRARTGS
jgi:glycerol kinase